MSIMTKPLPGTINDPRYPESDGEPMGESTLHMFAFFMLYGTLYEFFRRRTDILVAADLFWYYEQGNPRAVKAPDAMVVKGVGKHDRQTFKSWEENAIPCVVFEILSEKSYQDDLGDKRREYERLGVKEYFVFDPDRCFIDPPLGGYRLENEAYAPLQAADDGSLTSVELGLRLQSDGRVLRLIDLETGERLLTPAEAQQRADALAAEVARLQEALSQVKNNGGKP